MQCPKCGNALSQGDQFCGNCGFDMGNAPTLLSQKQYGFHAAPPIVGFNLVSAMLSIDNPYHALVPSLNMPNLVLNDDVANVWIPNTGVTPEGYKLSYIAIEPEEQITYAYASLKDHISAFTFEAIVSKLTYNFSGFLKLIWGVPNNSVEWKIGFRQSVGNLSKRAFNEKERSLWVNVKTRFSGDEQGFSHSLQQDGVAPFLLGLIMDELGIHVYSGRQLVVEFAFLHRVSLKEASMEVQAHNADFLIGHTKVWVP